MDELSSKKKTCEKKQGNKSCSLMCVWMPQMIVTWSLCYSAHMCMLIFVNIIPLAL